MGVICCNSEGTPAIAYGAVNPKTLRLESGLLHVELEASTIALRENGKRSIAGPGTVIRVEWPVRDIADRWITLDPDQQPEFPLTLLVQAWHSRPRPAMLSTRTTGRIFPAKLAMAPRTDRRVGRVFSHAAHVGEREGELVLPGFQTDRTAPALPLQLYDLGLGAAHSEKTTGAPLALRMFVESLLAISQEDRRGDGPVAISIALRDSPGQALPGASRAQAQRVLAAPHESSQGPGQHGSADSLARPGDGARWTQTGGVGGRHPARAGGVGRSGAYRGGSAARLPERAAGVGQPRPVGTEAPEGVPRTVEPGFLVAQSRSNRASRGPAADGKGRHWQQPAAAAYYPTMSDAELVDIVFPTSRRTRVGNLVGEARQVLKNLERAGELRVLEDKVLPPLNPPPRHG